MAGQKINDHKSWMGAPGKNMVMPMGAKTKSESSAEGAGELMKYEDTTEAIKSSQVAAVRKIKSHSPKPDYRN